MKKSRRGGARLSHPRKKSNGADRRTLLLLGMLAGAFIALAGAAAHIRNVYVGKVAGAAIFPAGLTMVVLAGSELFTATACHHPAARARSVSSGRYCAAGRSSTSNFLGSMLVAGLCSAAGTLDVVRDAVIATAEMKRRSLWRGAAARRYLQLPRLHRRLDESGRRARRRSSSPLRANLRVRALRALSTASPTCSISPRASSLGANVGWGGFLLSNLLPVTLWEHRRRVSRRNRLPGGLSEKKG